MNGTHVFLCEGKGIAIYNITGTNEIVFTILRSRGCSSSEFDVLIALDSVIYFRIRDFSILYLYDFRMTPITTAAFRRPLRFNQKLGDNQVTTTINPPSSSSSQITPPQQPPKPEN